MADFLIIDDILAAQSIKTQDLLIPILPQFHTIIEIGFHRGGFSLFLHKNKLPSTSLYCYDITLDHLQYKGNDINFIQGDCFNEIIINQIKQIIQISGKTLVLCDGGNKNKEFNLYSSFLKLDDVIMCHDYAHDAQEFESITSSIDWAAPFESCYEGIRNSVIEFNLEPYYYNDFKMVLWGSFIKTNKKIYDVSVVLQYNTTDISFLEVNLKQCSKFSEEIIVVMCSHLFNGDDENAQLLQKSIEIINLYPSVRLIIFPFDHINKQTITYWHNLSRFLGFSFVTNDWVLFLDADEIPSDEFKDWFEYYRDKDIGVDFTCYWYFREPIYQSTTLESAGFLVRKKHCLDWNLQDKLERKQFYQKLYDDEKLIHGQITPFWSSGGKILMHHYSWVRNKQQMLSKVTSWAHKDDKDWTSCVEEEFSRDFNGVDFVHGYNYNIVENEFKIII